MAKILLLSHSPVGKSMKGPAIRYWEMADVLSGNHEVTLSTPDQRTSLDRLEEYDVVITQMISHRLAWQAKRHGVRLILDAYDPMPLENLEVFKEAPLHVRVMKNDRIVDRMNFSFKMADGILCANNRQKDFWTGLLLSLKQIDPMRYDQNRSLDKFIKIVPFGMSSIPPKRSSDEGLRKKFSIPEGDRVILWGGGIWHWFDPLTLICAMGMVAQNSEQIHLVFMGVDSEMPLAADAIALSKALQLFGKTVHFNEGWVAYEERANYLLEADIGVSTHFDHLETQYAFRTRMLDYLYAGLPIIATKGDSFADLIENEGIGFTVVPEDPKALAEAIVDLASKPELIESMRDNIAAIKPQFYWSHVLKPLEEMIEDLVAKPKPGRMHDFLSIVSSMYRLNGPKALWKEFKSRLVKN